MLNKALMPFLLLGLGLFFSFPFSAQASTENCSVVSQCMIQAGPCVSGVKNHSFRAYVREELKCENQKPTSRVRVLEPRFSNKEQALDLCEQKRDLWQQARCR